MNPIEQWFLTKDFYEGVALLRRCGVDTTRFDPYLNESFIPPQYRARVEACIAALEPTAFHAPVSVVVRESVRPSTDGNRHIQDLRQEARLLHKRHADRHAQLHVLETPELRLPIITEIMEAIIPALDDIYDAIRNGGVRKNVFVEAAEERLDYRQAVQEGYQKAQRVSYLKNRIFKLASANGLINKAKDTVEKQKFETELTQKQAELNTLCIELGITENTNE